jgi:hypothetical protein
MLQKNCTIATPDSKLNTYVRTIETPAGSYSLLKTPKDTILIVLPNGQLHPWSFGNEDQAENFIWASLDGDE